jgi:hypothetical protein
MPAVCLKESSCESLTYQNLCDIKGWIKHYRGKNGGGGVYRIDNKWTQRQHSGESVNGYKLKIKTKCSFHHIGHINSSCPQIGIMGILNKSGRQLNVMVDSVSLEPNKIIVHSQLYHSNCSILSKLFNLNLLISIKGVI